MTTIIAIKSTDGIVMASDSQATTPTTKNLEVSKIYRINDSIGMSASGKEFQIKILLDKLKQDLENKEFDSESNLRKQLDNILIELYKTYNVERSIKLGYKETKLHFNPQALIAAKLKNNEFCLYYIYFNETTSWITLIDSDYMAIGSGSTLANFVLMQQSRPYISSNQKLSDMNLLHNIGVATIVINEVKAVDRNTGGKTKIVLIRDKYVEISEHEQQQFYEWMKSNLSNSLKILFENTPFKDKTETLIKTAFPSN